MKLKDYLRFFLGIPLTILAFVFIGKIFLDNRTTITTSFLSANPLLLLLGFASFGVFFFIKAIIWIKILNTRGHSPDIKSVLFQYSLSEAKRYIPGSIFAFISRVDIHKEIPKKETVKGIGIEAILLAGSALIVSLPASIFLLNKYTSFGFIANPLLLILAIASGVFFFTNKKIRDTFYAYFDSFALYVLAWIFYGVGSLLVALSIFSFDIVNSLTIASFFVLSWLCGYLLFITPMGLGVRELVITFALSSFVGIAEASAIAIMSRVAMVIGELFFLVITRLISKAKDLRIISKFNPYLSVVVVISIFYFFYFSFFTILKHNNFLTGRFDLGNMSQTVWNTSQGRFFMLTNPDGIENMSRLGVHSDYLLAFLAPLFWIWADPRMLLIFQSFALASGGIFVFFIAKKVTKSELIAVAFAISYYANFWLHEQNIFDFHAITIATPLLLAAYLYLVKKKYLLFAGFLFLAAITKENVLLVVSAFGLYFLKEKKWLFGGILTILGIAGFFYLTSVAIPGARGASHFALGTYSNLGDSTEGIIKNLLLNPGLALNQIFNFSTLSYLHQHLLPVGYLAILSPLYFVFVLPDMAIYLLSNNYEYRAYQYHFGALIIPFMLIASMHGINLLIKKIRIRNIRKVLFYYIVIVSIFSMYSYSPLPGMKGADYSPFYVTNSQQIKNYLSLIPNEASVSASNSIGAHLSHRDHIYVVPFAIDTSDFVVFYNEKPETIDQINHLNYEGLIEDSENNFYLYKRGSKSICPACQP